MAWDNTSATSTKNVNIHQNGGVNTYSYPSSTLLSEAVQKASQTARLSTVIVKCDGNEVQPDAGSTPISQFGSIDIYPKFAGAI